MANFIALLLFFSLTLFPDIAFGAGIVPACGEGNVFGPRCDFCDLLQLFNNLVQFSIQLAVAVSTLMFAYAGFLYVTASANPKNLEQAKKIFGNVFLGFILILSAWLIIDLVLVVFTEKGFAKRDLHCAIPINTLQENGSSIEVIVSNINKPGLEKSLGATAKECDINSGGDFMGSDTPPAGYPDDYNGMSFEDGMNTLSNEATGASHEEMFAYISMTDGSSQWLFMGNGGQTYTVPNWSNLESYIQENDGSIENIQLIHTHPSLPQCGTSPPSLADIQQLGTITSEEFSALYPLISSRNLSFAAVDSSGYWTYDPPSNWEELQYGAQGPLIKDLQEDFAAIPEVQDTFNSRDKCSDPRDAQISLYGEALQGNLGIEAQRTAQRITRVFSSTNYARIAGVEYEFIVNGRYSSPLPNECNPDSLQEIRNDYIDLLDESGANIEYHPIGN